METKFCEKCSKLKSIEEYSGNKNTKDGRQKYCKECVNEYKKIYYLKNKERLLNKSRVRYSQNKEKILKNVKSWSQKNKEKVEGYKRNYANKNRELINYRLCERKKEDIVLKLKMMYRSKLNKILGSKKEKTFDLIGCTPIELKEHLEKQFKEGMTWENHGLFGWHIDHIIPLSSAKTEKQLKDLCHYTNLQPLWAKENIIKRNKIL